MAKVDLIGIDVTKTVFQIHDLDKTRSVLLKKDDKKKVILK